MLPLFRTTGDGNCLFNACSIALIGDETLSTCLRSLTCCELYLYADFYASCPILNYLESQNLVSNKNNAFVKMLSYKAADLLEKGNRLPAVYGEALCVIGLPIEAYYPIDAEKLQLNSYESLFNCTLNPRITQSALNLSLCIFTNRFLNKPNIPRSKESLCSISSVC